MTIRVLITGASGLLGRVVFKILSSTPGLVVKGLCLSRCHGDLESLDITDLQALRACIQNFQPHMIVHSAAEKKPDVIEKQPEVAQSLNITATKNLVDAAVEMKACVFFVSTDYVLDGKDPPYYEDARPNPLNAYGQSKLEGEKIVLAADSGNLVLRVPILYGDVEFIEESAVTVLFPKVLNNSVESPMSNYEKRYPTHCEDVGQFIATVIDKKFVNPSIEANEICGIFHFSSSEQLTKYAMALEMAKCFSLSSSHLVPDNNASGGASRPYNSHLASRKAHQFGLSVSTRTFAQGITQCLGKWKPA